jgi:hypothetical protein
MVKAVNEIPAELLDIQYLDFTEPGARPPWKDLHRVVAKHIGS